MGPRLHPIGEVEAWIIHRAESLPRGNSAVRLIAFQSGVLWFETIRSAIEAFENTAGKYAAVDLPTQQEVKDMPERRRILRERIWNWIFENQKGKRRVRTLIEKISASDKFASTEQFSTLVSEAHIELTEYIEHELLRPGSTLLHGELVSRDPHINSAIELLTEIFLQ